MSENQINLDIILEIKEKVKQIEDRVLEFTTYEDTWGAPVSYIQSCYCDEDEADLINNFFKYDIKKLLLLVDVLVYSLPTIEVINKGIQV